MLARILLITLAILAFALPSNAADGALTFAADLDEEEVFITTDFRGTELLLFGALDRASIDDIAIIITGPTNDVALRRKDKVAGIWLNTENANIVGIPSFYHILTTRPLNEIVSENTLKVNYIGFDYLPFKLGPHSRIDEGTLAEWKAGLVRNMQKTGLWSNQPGHIKVINDVLFRADITIPANVMPGKYKVRTLHFRDHAVVNENISTITVAKQGLSAKIYQVAHEYAPFYGIFAIIFAVSSGWLAAVAFRK
jgi:uncharacterized protein (TIGR02186 family)